VAAVKRLAAAAVLLVLAVGAALLAGDVRSWDRTLHRGDLVYAAAPGLASWTPSVRFPFGAAQSLLAVSDDVATRQAFRDYRVAAAASGHFEVTPAQAAALRRAQVSLVPIARSSDPVVAAKGRTLLGLLVLGGLAQSADESRVQAAFSDLADAVRANPDDVTAKYDLELLLRLSAQRGVRPVQPIGGGAGATGKRGGGSGIPGEGY
jgi:hypothetical protein